MVPYAKMILPLRRWGLVGLACCVGCCCGPTQPPRTAFFNPYKLLPCRCKNQVSVPYELCSGDVCHGFRFTQWREWSEYCQPCCVPCAAQGAVGEPTPGEPVAPKSDASTLELVPTPDDAPQEPLLPKAEVQPEMPPPPPPVKPLAAPPSKSETRITIPGSAPTAPAKPIDAKPPATPDQPKTSATNESSKVHVLSPPPRAPSLAQPASALIGLQPDLPSHLLLLRHLF